MNVFLLRQSGPEGRIEASLRAAIPSLIEAASFDLVLKHKSVDHEPPTILVVGPPGDEAFFERLVEVATQYHKQLFLILISDEISASAYKRLVRTGGAEWASARTAPREVLEIIARRSQQGRVSDKASVGPRNSQPVTICFIPTAGGVGNTTLVIESAIYLRTINATERKICILDLDFQTSHVCDYLDAEARLLIAEFSNAPERLDEHLLESFKTSHSSGIDIFAAPRSKFASEDLNVEALDALFSMIAKRYDLVFVDLPLTWFSWTTQVIAACDGAVITGLNTIPNLRQILETLSLVRTSSTTVKTGIVLNRCEKNVFGAVTGRKQVERLIPDEELFFIGSRAEAVESANMGVPMMLGASARKIREEFASLGNFCAALKSSRALSP